MNDSAVDNILDFFLFSPVALICNQNRYSIFSGIWKFSLVLIPSFVPFGFGHVQRTKQTCAKC